MFYYLLIFLIYLYLLTITYIFFYAFYNLKRIALILLPDEKLCNSAFAPEQGWQNTDGDFDDRAVINFSHSTFPLVEIIRRS